MINIQGRSSSSSSTPATIPCRILPAGTQRSNMPHTQTKLLHHMAPAPPHSAVASYTSIQRCRLWRGHAEAKRHAPMHGEYPGKTSVLAQAAGGHGVRREGVMQGVVTPGSGGDKKASLPVVGRGCIKLGVWGKCRVFRLQAWPTNCIHSFSALCGKLWRGFLCIYQPMHWLRLCYLDFRAHSSILDSSILSFPG